MLCHAWPGCCFPPSRPGTPSPSDMSSHSDNRLRLGISPKSVKAARAELKKIVNGIPAAEAAVDGFNDWQVIEATERLWNNAMVDAPSDDPAPDPPTPKTAARRDRRG